MSAQKKPEAGEFWEWGGVRVRVIGQRESGHYVCEHKCGTLRPNCTAADMTHLPDCDSFDWQPETFPQWYVAGEPSIWTKTAFVRLDSKVSGVRANIDGSEQRYIDGYEHAMECVKQRYWMKSTQAEAEARVKKPEPVESPDDWVTQDRVPDRPGIDQWARTWNGRVEVWEPSRNYEERYMHGHVCTETGSVFHVRCRRRDLPVVPQETPKREYFRLWTHRTSGTVCTSPQEALKYPDIWTELKHDGTGFYLEDAT